MNSVPPRRRDIPGRKPKALSHFLTVGHSAIIMLQGSFTYFKNQNEVGTDVQNDKVAMRTLALRRKTCTTLSGYLGQVTETARNHGGAQ